MPNGYSNDSGMRDIATDGVRMIQNNSYDFVLIVCQMPEKDGIWFLENAHIPRETKALLMTSFINRTVIKHMFDVGVCGYLIKPLEEEEILRHLTFHSKADVCPKQIQQEECLL